MSERTSIHELAVPVADVERVQPDVAVVATSTVDTIQESVPVEQTAVIPGSTTAMDPASSEPGDTAPGSKQNHTGGSLSAPLLNNSNSSKGVQEASESSTLWMGDLPYWADVRPARLFRFAVKCLNEASFLCT